MSQPGPFAQADNAFYKNQGYETIPSRRQLAALTVAGRGLLSAQLQRRANERECQGN